ncbi:MAG: hypothetical protein RL095_1396 [Verrucomicrobiota bacterium]|jgi:cytochrome c553
MRFQLPIYAVLAAAAFTACSQAKPGAAAQEAKPAPLDYNRDIRPILSDRCLGCHGREEEHREADLRLDRADIATAKREDGTFAIVPGKPEESEAWLRILSDDPEEMMPPRKSGKPRLTDAEKALMKRWIAEGAVYQEHWAFVPPQKAALPQPGNPVDAFVRDRLKQAGLELSPEAERATLLRRLSLVLTGLPPSPEEIAAFCADRDPDAYSKQVERLLASPRFGEHFASAWLDLARYADTNGYLADNLRTPWPWRDWVIKAINDDLPYDQFITQQIAGDRLPGATQEQILATGFLRAHPLSTEGGTIAAEYLMEYAADRVTTFGTAVLGLSVGCARCHDHKYDPINQADFYSLMAYFNSSTEKHHENNQSTAFPPLIECASPLQPGGARVKVMVMDEAKQAKPTFVHTRGQYDAPDAKRPVSRRPPEFISGAKEKFAADRLGLAQWTFSEANPLAARVEVNRLWMLLFGSGLVRTQEDFGLQGEYPSHRELLDWLAVEFRQQKWSRKQLLRLIVSSATFRQSSVRTPQILARDPDGRLLACFPRHRLRAEAVRDQALALSGLLVEKLGGAPVKPPQPLGLWEEKANEGSTTKVFVADTGEAVYRRSLYIFSKRNAPSPQMSIFDQPERSSCNVRRNCANTPLQALMLLNETQILEASRALAGRCLQEGSDEAALNRLWLLCTGKIPDAASRMLLQQAQLDFQKRYSGRDKDAQALAQKLTQNHAPARAAAWVLLANAALNADETLCVQ